MLFMGSAGSVMSASGGILAMRIREARSEDASGIARVQVDTSRHTYRGLVPRELLGRLSFPAQLCCWQRRLWNSDPNLVVHVGESAAGDVVGFAAAGQPRARLEGYDTELFAIYVLTSHQGYGLGERLIRSVMSTVSRRGGMSLFAWVIATNPYRRFFEGLAGRPSRSRSFAQMPS